MVVDAAITQAHEHYGCYCKALTWKEQAQGAHSKYNVVEQEFEEQWKDMEVIDSIRDTEVCEDKAEINREDGGVTPIEIRKASEIEQDVRDRTDQPVRALFPHPFGLKQDGEDGKSDRFGRAYTRVRKEKPSGSVRYIRTLPVRPLPEDVEEVEVYFAYRGQYSKVKVPSNLTQKEAEQIGGAHFEGNVCLFEFRPPTMDLTYRFKAMFCRNREEAARICCDRKDSADEEWVLFG
jgi:hypothetical protein